jgi:hypothetical protein
MFIPCISILNFIYLGYMGMLIIAIHTATTLLFGILHYTLINYKVKEEVWSGALLVATTNSFVFTNFHALTIRNHSSMGN